MDIDDGYCMKGLSNHPEYSFKEPRQIIRNKNVTFFDFDGTLFDSMDLWSDIDNKFLSARGITPPADYSKAVSALGFKETAIYTVNRFNLKETPEQLMNEWNNMSRDAYAGQIGLLPGAREYLNELYHSGIRLIGATSLHRELAILCLENNGIMDLFEKVITSDDVSISKSSPEFFQSIVYGLNVKASECILFDDVPKVIKAGKLSGLTTVAVHETRANTERKDFGEYCDFFIDSLMYAPIIKK